MTAIKKKRYQSIAQKQHRISVSRAPATMDSEQYLQHLVRVGKTHIRLGAALHRAIIVPEPAITVLRGFGTNFSSTVVRSTKLGPGKYEIRVSKGAGKSVRMSRVRGHVSE